MDENQPQEATSGFKPGWKSSEVQLAVVVAGTALVKAVSTLSGWPLVAALGIVAALVAVVVVARTWAKDRA